MHDTTGNFLSNVPSVCYYKNIISCLLRFSKLGPLLIVVAAVFTGILVVIPREPQFPTENEQAVVSYLSVQVCVCVHIIHVCISVCV